MEEIMKKLMSRSAKPGVGGVPGSLQRLTSRSSPMSHLSPPPDQDG